METIESLGAIVCLVLPVIAGLWLLLGWLLGRRRSGRPIRRYMPPESAIVEMVQAVTAPAVMAVQAIQSVETSIVAQIGVVAEMTVQAIGYLLARLRGRSTAPLLSVGEGDGALHVVVAGETYTLDVEYQRQRPESYGGAEVDLVEPVASVKLDILVEGTGCQVSNRGQSALEIESGQQTRTTLQVKPLSEGKTRLRIDFYQGTAWTQQLDLPLEVRSQEEVEDLKDGAPGMAGLKADVIAATAAEGSITLPDTVPHPIRRHLHLSIAFAPNKEEGRTFSARANDGQGWRKIDVIMRERDLAEVNAALREALDELRQYLGDRIEQGEDEAAAEEYLQALDELAMRGNAAFKRIFPREEDRAYISRALAREGEANLEISTDSFFLPWELLYDSYDPENVSFSGFWGFRYNISCILTNVRQKQSPLVSTKGRPRIALFANPELDSVRDYEVPYFRELGDQGKIRLWDWLKDVESERDTTTERQQRSAFLEYSRAHESDVAHFACHVDTGAVHSFDYYIELSSILHVRLVDMEARDYSIGGSPVIVLNACGTSVRDPLRTSDFVRRFMLQGGRGVLATECDVPDEFASVFIQQVYDRLLDGETFGRALLSARLHYLREYRNPLGLLYSAYLPLETRFLMGAM